MGTIIIIGMLIGLCCGSAIEIIVSHLLKIEKKRKQLEEERFKTFEMKLSVVAEKCDRTQKACRLLSDIVKENYKTEEKEERETSKIPWSEIDKINARNMGHRINRREIEEMMNSTHSVLYPQTYSTLNQQECSIEENIRRNLELMRNCSYVPAEEAQRRIFHALYPGWSLPDDPD